MHRLLKAASIQRSNVYYSAYIRPPCSLCNRRNILSAPSLPVIRNLPTRNFTTEELRAAITKAFQKKRRSKTKKKYAELVEVNDDKTNLTKAVVKKLSAKNVSRLSEESSLSLEQFHELLSKKMKTSKNAKDLISYSAPTRVKKGPLDRIVLLPSNENLLPEEYVGVSIEHSVFEETGEKDDVLGSIPLSSMNEELLQNKYEGEAERNLIQHDTENVGTLSKDDIYFRDIMSSLVEEKPEVSQKPDESKKSEKVKEIPNDKPPGLKPIKLRGLHRIKIRQDTSVPISFNELLSGRPAKTQQREIEKNKKLNECLNSYIELCVQCDLLNLAFGTINRYVRLHLLKVRKTRINGPKAFNLLLHGFASKANIDKIGVILTLMSSCNIKRSPQTFAAYFECLSRLPSTPENLAKLTKMHKELTDCGFVFDDLMNRCRYVRDQRDHVLKSIRVLDPTYTWKYPEPPLDYSVQILKELNDDHTPYQSPIDPSFTAEQLKKWASEQANIESKYSASIESAMKPAFVSPRTKAYRAEWTKMSNTWRVKLRDGFTKNLSALESQLINTKACYQANVFPYLRVLPIDMYVDIMLDEVHRLLLGSLSYSSTVMSLHRCLGKQVKLRYDIKYREHSGYINKLNKVYKEYCKWYLHPETNPTSRNPRHQWQKLTNEMAAIGPTVDDLSRRWPPNMFTEIGKFLYNTIIEYVDVDVNCMKNKAQPNWQRSFYSLYRYQSQHLFEEIRPNSFLHKFYRETQPDHINFAVDFLPMVSPPRPWTTMKSGGYLFTKTDCIRLMDFGILNPDNPNNARPPQQLYGVFDSLNQLSSVPWKINTRILDIALKVFKEGGSLSLKIPLSSTKFVQIEKKKQPKEITFQNTFQTSQRKREMYALWVECLYRLSLANHFRDRTIWLPHNMDFRGRVYPIPPHLSHIGSDMARSLLIFAKGEKLGTRGLDWLKIHCVNLTGLKKREPLSERLRYAEEILPEILDSAEKPLTGNMWWTRSDDIWQTLACCMEIKSAIDSGDPDNYVCHFPVHQDGSCNGLQHYAALGRDAQGARSVNLIPCDTPQDVYSCVVEKVEEQRALDAARGREVARSLEGFIKRKVIKQTVMTTVYGVTHYGARMQIAKQLKATKNLPTSVIWPGSSYLVCTTFNTLRSMFTSTRLIQDWLVECARHLTKNCGEFVQWETPLGLLAFQPYAKLRSLNKTTSAGGHVLTPHMLKQKNAFPPNYIHSLDSSHMMLTSLQMERKGATFVSVHDCFWTHPNQVEVLNEVCRQEFVKLHSLPLLEDMSAFFIANFEQLSDAKDAAVLKQIPKKGSLDLNDVLRSTYFFS